jgi:hypothetical protein
LACDNYRMAGWDTHDTTEDWGEFDYVFSGVSPDPEGDAMIVKLRLLDSDAVEGEIQSVFWAEFAGTWIGDDVKLTMTFADPKCDDPAHASFAGVSGGTHLIGRFEVFACEWYEFDYAGELAGGAAFTE